MLFSQIWTVTISTYDKKKKLYCKTIYCIVLFVKFNNKVKKKIKKFS